MSPSRVPVSVRVATVADAAAIARVHVLGWQVAYRGLVPDTILDGLSIERRAAFWTNVIDQPRYPGQGTWVAESNRVVVGFLTCGPCRDGDGAGLGELQAIYALPERWGAGVGHALHEVCVVRLVGDGFPAATLWVLEGNARALKFYERHGWKPDGASKIEVFDGATLNEIRLRRDLTLTTLP
jgi:GNAT superfamily N-acetyltransferase